jgi:hypothetical protein
MACRIHRGLRLWRALLACTGNTFEFFNGQLSDREKCFAFAARFHCGGFTFCAHRKPLSSLD